MTTQPTGWHPEDIKAAIRKRYGSLLAFERTAGLPQRSCRDVLAGKARPRIAKAMAEAIGVEIHKLFPGRYTSNGDTIIRRRKTSHRLSARGR